MIKKYCVFFLWTIFVCFFGGGGFAVRIPKTSQLYKCWPLKFNRMFNKLHFQITCCPILLFCFAFRCGTGECTDNVYLYLSRCQSACKLSLLLSHFYLRTIEKKICADKNFKYVAQSSHIFLDCGAAASPLSFVDFKKRALTS